MYSRDGIFYDEQHSISFGIINDIVINGDTWVDYDYIGNSWTDMCLIPSSRPVVAHPTVVTKTVEKAGKNGYADLTTALTNRPNYGLRTGSWSFYVDTARKSLSTIQNDMVELLDGKRLNIILNDDPNYFYDGRITIGNFTSGAIRPSATINYQLLPYKYKIDYDRYDITVSGGSATRQIQALEYPFKPKAIWVNGNVTVTFGGVSKTLSSSGSAVLGAASMGSNTLTVSGSGRVKIEWRGGAL